MSVTLKYTGGAPGELAFTVNGHEYVQKPGEDLIVADETDAAYFLGLGAWEEFSKETEVVKYAVSDSTRSSKSRPSGDTGNG